MPDDPVDHKTDTGEAEAEEPRIESDDEPSGEAAAGTEAATPPQPTPEERLAKLQADTDAKIAAQRDQLLRLAADFDNYRKRAQKQETEAADRARTDAIKGFLATADNLDRGIEHAEKATEIGPVVEGLRLVAKQFQDALGSLGVERLPCAVGKGFDPSFHDAISQIAAPDAAPGTVVSELQAGYLLKGRLLRPAMVVVAKRAPKPAVEPKPVEASKPAEEPKAPGPSINDAVLSESEPPGEPPAGAGKG